jgi:hypothetical protein
MRSLVQVLAWWGDDVIGVWQVDTARGFTVGPDRACDFVAPVDTPIVVLAPAAAGGHSETTVGDLSFWVEPVADVDRRLRWRFACRSWFPLLVSVVVHVVVGCSAYIAPALEPLEDDQRQVTQMRYYLYRAAEREQEKRDNELEPSPDERPGCPKGSNCDLGNPIERHQDDSERYWEFYGAEVVREAEGANVSFTGLLSQSNLDPNAPLIPWGTGFVTMPGPDCLLGVCDLTGTGEGDGGLGEGIGLGNLGPISDYGRVPPVIRSGTATISGIPRDVVDGVVRERFGSLATCYRAGVKGTPALREVAVRFVIGVDGVARDAQAGSQLPEGVLRCVIREFEELRFPPPRVEANVSYTLVFDP